HATRRVERLVRGGELAQGRFASLEALCQRDLFLGRQQLVMSDFAQVHGTCATRQLLGKQPEPADRLGRNRFCFRIGIDSLGQFGTEEFFTFMQKIDAHSLLLLLVPVSGVKKAAQTKLRGSGGDLTDALQATHALGAARTATDKTAKAWYHVCSGR